MKILNKNNHQIENDYKVVLPNLNRKPVYLFSGAIENGRNPNGRYMIKRMELKYGQMSFHLYAYRKSYFTHSNAGVGFSLRRRDNSIFRTNNKVLADRIARAINWLTYSQ